MGERIAGWNPIEHAAEEPREAERGADAEADAGARHHQSIADDKPRELAVEDREQQKFWQGVRQSPTRTARNIRGTLREMDRRLADIESYVTTENRTLAKEIERLR